MCQSLGLDVSNSAAIEDYAKAIYAIGQERDGLVLNGEVAQRLEVTPATATSMLKKLAELGLVDYLPYKGVSLTPAGEKVALEVIRHHRLIEAYLSEALGMPEDRVHEEAEVLEHYISEELEALIAAKLGEPRHDPHGTPIPGPDLVPPNWEARGSGPRRGPGRWWRIGGSVAPPGRPSSRPGPPSPPPPTVPSTAPTAASAAS